MTTMVQPQGLQRRLSAEHLRQQQQHQQLQQLQQHPWAPATPQQQHARNISITGNLSNTFPFEGPSSVPYETPGTISPNAFLLDQAFHPSFGSPLTGDLDLDILQPSDVSRRETDEPWSVVNAGFNPATSFQMPVQPYYPAAMSNAGSHSQYELSEMGEYPAYRDDTTPITSQPSVAFGEAGQEVPHHGYVNPVHTQSSKAPSVASATTNASAKRKHADFSCTNCNSQLRTESEYKKHKARHDRVHTCPVPNCDHASDGSGFTTSNDLERHMGSKHNIFLPDTKLKVYVCKARGCESKQKKLWPRYDNFKQHIERMHPHFNVDEIVAKSKVAPPVTAQSRHYKKVLDERASLHERTDSSSSIPPLDFFLDPQMAGGSSATTAGFNSGLRPDSIPSHQGGARERSQFLSIPRSRRKSDVSGSGSNSRSGSVSPQSHRGRSATLDNLKPRLEHVNTQMPMSDTPNIVVSPSPDERSPRDESSLEEVVRQLAQERDPSKIMDCLKELQARSNPASPSQKQPLDPGLQDAVGDPVDEMTLPNVAVRGGTSSQIRCGYPGCDKAFTRECDLKKHHKRHERPYGCTFENCVKTFGSKNDWKRHENGQHFQQETWRCSFAMHKTYAAGQVPAHEQCAQLFDSQHEFKAHIRSSHEEQIRDWKEHHLTMVCDQNHIGANGQQSFWCGFCRKIVPLEAMDLKAWDERFNHIGEHFKTCNISSWLVCGGQQTKGEARRQRAQPHGEVESESSESPRYPSGLKELLGETAQQQEASDDGTVANFCTMCKQGPFSDLHSVCTLCGTPLDE